MYLCVMSRTVNDPFWKINKGKVINQPLKETDNESNKKRETEDPEKILEEFIEKSIIKEDAEEMGETTISDNLDVKPREDVSKSDKDLIDKIMFNQPEKDEENNKEL